MTRILSCWLLALTWALAPTPAAAASPQTQAALQALERARSLLEQSQPAQAYQALQEATLAVWQAMPLTAQVTLVSRKGTAYGDFTPRADNTFPSRGGRIVLRLEPAGFSFRPQTNGGWRYGFSVDAYLLDENGVSLFGRKGILRLERTTRRRPVRLEAYLTLSLKMAPPGNYTIKLVIHDLGPKPPAEAKIPVILK